ncbi:hypothetical protein SAMN05216249_11848 [Acetitomaculum ruminis DSM 5522]|uniref:Uncharacterized protein n=1 Tax=Acetitomaculum ruminis DSM 5522 TaxID=1120918 RepID=A0A1I1A0X2_9FIRM|nr:hypothetical protein [Acetitomaculum ruminis]SFB30218.1 hypothetical protein SAMN05216249_11848 [Acetitomaculum ruminis DSM 5522]
MKLRVLSMLIAVMMVFSACGGNAPATDSSKNESTKEAEKTTQEDKEKVPESELSNNEDREKVSESELPYNEDKTASDKWDFEFMGANMEIKELSEFQTDHTGALDLDSWFVDCGADDHLICTTEDSTEVVSFKAVFGQWVIEVTTKNYDSQYCYIYIYTPGENAYIKTDYSSGIELIYNMTDDDSQMPHDILDYLYNLVVYVKTCPDNPVILYGIDGLPVEKLE